MQNVPELLSYIQVVVVDEYDDAKFILTGSSNFALMESITQSLAGRSAVFTLLPLSHQKLGDKIRKTATNTFILNGGYPAVWGKNIPVQDVSKNYYNTYVERDVRQFLVDSISQSNLEDNSSLEHNIRHINILEKIQTGLEDIEMAFEQSVPSDLIAIDVRQCLHYLGELTGQISTDELLGSIFGRFCIGK